MPPMSSLLFTPPSLANCISIGIVRDTRAAALSTNDRLNYFPATPLVALTIVRQGRLRTSPVLCDLDDIREKDVVANVSVSLPQMTPTLSWSDGPIHAITIGFFPDAWVQMGGDMGSTEVPPALARAATHLLNATDITAAWDDFCDQITPVWTKARAKGQLGPWAGSHRVADWTRHVLTRAALSGAGQSARSIERRMKRWTGQSKQALRAFAQMEDLHKLVVNHPDAPLAAIASDAQFSDQSHMGRAVKKATGFSPRQLNQLIETSEAFWCYRLLGERL